MILFGHLGLTTGAAKLLETTLSKRRHAEPPDVDYRLVLAGALLPDIIDKPVGAFLFVDTFHNSRIYAHTLLFSLVLLIAGAVLYRRRKKSVLLTLGLACLFHLALDKPWLYLETFLWPILNIGPALSAGNGWLPVLLGFPYKFDDWIANNMISLFNNPSPLIFEILGLAILIWLFICLLRRKKIKEFFRMGKL